MQAYHEFNWASFPLSVHLPCRRLFPTRDLVFPSTVVHPAHALHTSPSSISTLNPRAFILRLLFAFLFLTLLSFFPCIPSPSMNSHNSCSFLETTGTWCTSESRKDFYTEEGNTDWGIRGRQTILGRGVSWHEWQSAFLGMIFSAVHCTQRKSECNAYSARFREDS